MNHSYRFEKILDLKSKEKDAYLIVYEEAKRHFEEVAEKLYGYLKSKENFIEEQEAKLAKGISIFEIKQHQGYLSSIEKSIAAYQTKVIEARQMMHAKESVLKEKNIEVKKYETLKEKDHLIYLENLNAQEGLLMDEISIQQYMNQSRR